MCPVRKSLFTRVLSVRVWLSMVVTSHWEFPKTPPLAGRSWRAGRAGTRKRPGCLGIPRRSRTRPPRGVSGSVTCRDARTVPDRLVVTSRPFTSVREDPCRFREFLTCHVANIPASLFNGSPFSGVAPVAPSGHAIEAPGSTWRMRDPGRSRQPDGKQPPDDRWREFTGRSRGPGRTLCTGAAGR